MARIFFLNGHGILVMFWGVSFFQGDLCGQPFKNWCLEVPRITRGRTLRDFIASDITLLYWQSCSTFDPDFSIHSSDSTSCIDSAFSAEAEDMFT
jgi:hypothetical protein